MPGRSFGCHKIAGMPVGGYSPNGKKSKCDIGFRTQWFLTVTTHHHNICKRSFSHGVVFNSHYTPPRGDNAKSGRRMLVTKKCEVATYSVVITNSCLTDIPINRLKVGSRQVYGVEQENAKYHQNEVDHIHAHNTHASHSYYSLHMLHDARARNIHK